MHCTAMCWADLYLHVSIHQPHGVMFSRCHKRTMHLQALFATAQVANRKAMPITKIDNVYIQNHSKPLLHAMSMTTFGKLHSNLQTPRICLHHQVWGRHRCPAVHWARACDAWHMIVYTQAAAETLIHLLPLADEGMSTSVRRRYSIPDGTCAAETQWIRLRRQIDSKLPTQRQL